MINTLGFINWNLLHYACTWGNLEVVKNICANPDFDIDYNALDDMDSTALYLACLGGHFEVVKYLLDNSRNYGIDISKEDIDQLTAEDAAREFGHQDILDLFEMHQQLDVCFWNAMISLTSPTSLSEVQMFDL